MFRRYPSLEELIEDDDEDVVTMLLEWKTFMPVSDELSDREIKSILNYYHRAKDEFDDY